MTNILREILEGSAYPNPDLLKEITTKYKNEEAYFIIDRKRVVKVSMSASKRDRFDEYAKFCVRVLQVDGVAVPHKEQIQKQESFECERMPELKELERVFQRVLNNFGIYGRPVKLSEELAEGFIKVQEIRQNLRREVK